MKDISTVVGLGVKGTNGLILGSGIDILEEALAKASVEGVTTPVFVERLDIQVCVYYVNS